MMTAKEMVDGLLSRGLTADTISKALDRRVSKRTVYRWAKGESQPQQFSDLYALEQLYEEQTKQEAEEPAAVDTQLQP